MNEPGLDFSAVSAAAFMVACEFGMQGDPFNKPLPLWWPFRWARRTLGPDGTWSLEVSEAEERPW